MGRAVSDGSPRNTPLMRQYREAKRSHPDAIMLFRMGDFYETFDEDAKKTSEILGIALTKRSNQGRSSKAGPASEIPLAGFPHHALDAHLYKLLKAGYKVAICEQVEDPKVAKGIVKREVVEVITPGTALADKYLEGGQPNYLAGIYAANNRLGVALLEHSTGEFLLEELTRTDLAEWMMCHQPSEILLAESQESELLAYLGSTSATLTKYQDWIADYENAVQELLDHFKITSLKGFDIEAYPLGISAAASIIHYICENRPGSNPHISNIKAIQDRRFMGLDSFTVRNLELFQSLATQGTHGTLISVIDKTSTAAGSRLLKQWLRSPLQEIDTIQTRLQRVKELVDNNRVREEIQILIRSSSDIERILGRLSTGRATPRDINGLVDSLEIIRSVQNLIQESHTDGLRLLIDEVFDVTNTINIIQQTLVEDPPLNIQKGGYIREGIDHDLDELRTLMSSGKSWIISLQEEERKRTGIPSLKVGYNNIFGYFLEVTKTHQDKIPDSYIRKQTLVNAERYITPELKEYEEKILSAEEKILALEKEIFTSLQKQILEHVVELQHNARILAKVDVAAGFAEVASSQKYSCPEFVDEPILSIRESRHPVVEILLPLGERFTPNDLEMNPETSQIHIITGPNMAGKSTFLRQIGLTVVMAQIGSYVPAKSCTLGIVDRLFTRVGASDNLAGGESTFLVEMVESARILHNATPQSLVLLDEIGRGTATYDGMSIAWAVTEYLHQNHRSAAKTLFATHYHELVTLGDILPRVRNYHVAVREHQNEVVFLRKIVPGGADKSYGIHVAKMAGLPDEVINRAGEILATLLSKDQRHVNIETHTRIDNQIEIFSQKELELQTDFKQIDVDSLTPIEALNLLDQLKKKHGL